MFIGLHIFMAFDVNGTSGGCKKMLVWRFWRLYLTLWAEICRIFRKMHIKFHKSSLTQSVIQIDLIQPFGLQQFIFADMPIHQKSIDTQCVLNWRHWNVYAVFIYANFIQIFYVKWYRQTSWGNKIIHVMKGFIWVT